MLLIIKKHFLSFVIAVVLWISLMSIVGCTLDKMTRVNYETVYIGLDGDGVIKRMGEPTEKTDQSWVFIREKGGYRKATIVFRDGVVYDTFWTFDRDSDR